MMLWECLQRLGGTLLVGVGSGRPIENDMNVGAWC